MEQKERIRALDELYRTGNCSRIEAFLEEEIAQAESEGDWRGLIFLQNEQMGLLRETGRAREAIQVFSSLTDLFREKGLTETEAFAGTLQNGANAHRAAGEHAKAVSLFQTALDLYRHLLAPSDYRIAGLMNNLALVYQETGDFGKALELGENALAIVSALPDTEAEQATSHTNLAELACRMGDGRSARLHIESAERLFGREPDPHRSALWAVKGQLALEEKRAEDACRCFEEAREILRSYYGENGAYAVVTGNLAAAKEAAGDMEAATVLRNEARRIREAQNRR